MALFPRNKQHRPKSSAVNVAAVDITNKKGEIQAPDSSDSGAVVILYPPKKFTKWSFSRLMLICKIWLLNLIDPAIDKGTEHSVSKHAWCFSLRSHIVNFLFSYQRLEKLMAAHDIGLDLIKRRYSRSEIWYLEVIAIHPLLQSCGLGKLVMQEIFRYAQDQCIALECTSESSIPFYEKLGFSVVQDVELAGDTKSPSDDHKTVKYWLMVKDNGVQGS